MSEIALRGEVLPLGQLTLFELAETANREHELALRSGMAMLEHASRAGEALIAAKAQLRHGEWLPWLADNFVASERTAQGYMTIARNPQRVADLDEPSLRRALEAIVGEGKQYHPFEPVATPELPTGTYAVLYADPPWQYEHASPSRAIERHYPTMSTEAIAALEVPAADDAVCFLWATNPKLGEALDVLDAWGFEYRTNLVWVKDQIGMGYYVRAQHELLLIGRRGDFPHPATPHRPASVLYAPRGRHSEKPASAYDLIEAMYPSAARVELFARSDRPGWDRWGAIAA